MLGHCDPQPAQIQPGKERPIPQQGEGQDGLSPFLLSQCFSSNRAPALEVLLFILFIKLMLGRILGSARA